MINLATCRQCSKHRALLATAILWAVAMMVVSCGSRGEAGAGLFDVVPADASAVVKADFGKLLAEAGCDIVDGRYVPDDVLVKALADSEESTRTLVELLCDFAPEVQLESTCWFFTDEKSEPIVTLIALDQEALRKRLGKKTIATVSIDGYDVYTFKGACAVLRGNHFWVARSADAVIDSTDDAVANPLSADRNKVEALDAEGDMTAVISSEMLSVLRDLGASGKSYMRLAMKCMRNGFRFMAGVDDADGTLIEICSGVDEINPWFTAFMPQRTAACVAVGALDWKKIYPSVAGAVTSKFGGNGLVISSLLKPYMEAVDGSVAIAVAPAAGVQSLGEIGLSSWEFFMSAKMPQDKLDRFATLVTALAAVADVPVKEVGHDMYELTMEEGGTLTAGCIDGHFVVANYDLALAGHPESLQGLSGRTVALEANVAKGSDLALMLGLPFGVSIDAGTDRSDAVATVRLNGINTTPLKALLQYLSK